MRILVTGGLGMLGRTLVRRLDGHEVRVVDLPEVDITDAAAVTAAVGAFRRAAVVHCAAMTAVDACETALDQALRVNGVGSANVAVACHLGNQAWVDEIRTGRYRGERLGLGG